MILLGQTKTLKDNIMSVLDKQVGGDHYKNFKIQPIEFSTLNNLGFIEGCIVKRICRYQSQEDPIKDLDKIIHEIQIIKEVRYGYADSPEQHGQVILDTGNFVVDLTQLISTQDKWSKEELITVIRALRKNKYSS